MQINITDYTYFISTESGKSVDSDELEELETFVPPYLQPEDSAMLLQFLSGLKVNLEAVISSNAIVSIFMGGSMAVLWGMIRGMQYIILLVLIQVYQPPFSMYFFRGIMVIASLDLYKGEEIINFLFTFSDDQDFNRHFALYDVQGSNFLIHTGSIIFPIAFLVIARFCVYKILNKIAVFFYKVKVMRQIGVYIYPQSKGLFKIFLKLFIESSFEFSLSAIL